MLNVIFLISGPSDCDDIFYKYGIHTSGTYFIYPDAGMGPVPMKVWCDMNTAGGGWTVSIGTITMVIVIASV